MKFDCTINIEGVDYKFNSIEDEPLMYIMNINENYDLIREINCDIPFEKWTLIKKYKSILNGIEKDDFISDQVYHGKDINDENFMKQLFENVIFHIFVDGEQDIRTM